MDYRLSIVIPCFNEERTILEMLGQLTSVPEFSGPNVQFIVVDDGSTDGTRELLKQSRFSSDGRFKFIYLEQNSGKGAAVRHGIAAAEGAYTVVQDADLEYDPSDIARLLEKAEQEKLPAVYGSRYLDPKARRGAFLFFWGGKLTTWAADLLFGKKLTDMATCYKLVRTDILKSLPLTCTGFEFDPEITALLLQRRVAICEMPISYAPRTKGEGKKIKWRDGLVWIWTLVKVRFTFSSPLVLALLVSLFAFFVYALTWYRGFMGYEQETAQAAISLTQGGYQIFRAGIGAVLLYVPFVWAAELLRLNVLGFLPIAPIFYSALIPGVVYLILHKLAPRVSVNVLTSVLVAVATLVWPYSRIGMEYQTALLVSLLLLSLLWWKEEKTSILVPGLVLAYLALTKSYGPLFAVPALLFVFTSLKRQWRPMLSFSFLAKLLLSLLSAIAIPAAINYAMYDRASGAYFLAQEFQIWSWWEGFFGTFFSFGKSIFLFNPLLIVALFYWPGFWKRYPAASSYVVSSFIILLTVTAPFSFWSDETLSVRKLVPIIPLLHLPLVLAFTASFRESASRFNEASMRRAERGISNQDRDPSAAFGMTPRIKTIAVIIVIILAVYIQFINSLYPYWRQLEFLKPYSLDSLTPIRYSPRISSLTLNNTWFASYVKYRLTGKPGHYFFLERSWMRCCTQPPGPDPVLVRIDTSLEPWHKPDSYILSDAPKRHRASYLVVTLAGSLIFGGILGINYAKHKKLKRTTLPA